MIHSRVSRAGQAGAALLAACLLCLCAPAGSGPEAGGREAMEPGTAASRPVQGPKDAAKEPPAVDAYIEKRKSMVLDQMRDVRDRRVLAAMRTVPRHLFVPPAMAPSAYEDRPLLIGHEQTISQPYIVAFMTQAARLEPGQRVLEIGTGSGYQAAILAELGCEVWSIEIIPELHAFAAANLEQTGYSGRVHLRCGDGYAGWPEAAPFDAIVVTAAPPEIPETLKAQLKIGGRLVVPVGSQRSLQELVVVTRREEGFRQETLFPVRFVPMVRGKPGGE